MSESYNINSILVAVDDLNNRTRNTKVIKKNKLFSKDEVPPQVDKIIREAEQFKKENLLKITSKSMPESMENSNLVNDKSLALNKKIKEIEISFNKEISELKTKLEYQTIIYKESYDKLLLENNDIKQRLANAKNHIHSFQEAKSDIVSTISSLNQIISKSEIIGKIEPNSFSLTSSKKKLDLKNNEIKD